MEYQAPSVSFTRNELSNSHSFSPKSMYDGVFGAPSKFGVPTFSARVDEYRDIFTGSEASGGSSIPILDIPELNERKISVDDRSSKVDYTDIFGGFAESDFAEPYEQIFLDPKKNENVPEEASGKPTEKVSTSEVFGTYSEGNHDFPLETYEKPLNDIKKFNMSYHKVNNRKNDGTNGTTHVAQLHAVPGYTCVFDEVAPLPVNEGNKFVSSDVNDSCPSNNLREESVIGNHIRKTMADFPTSVTSNGTSVKLFDTHENAHGTHQPEVSTTPSSLDNNSGSSERPMASRFWKTNTDTFEGSNNYCSPSFDEEVDKNSFAATSVAALRKAIEEAQARIKIAKELKGRKTVGLQHRVKLSFKGGIKDDEEKNGQFVDEVNISRIKKAHESHEEMDALSHTSAGMTNHNLIGPDQVTLGIKPQEKISHAKEVEREILGKNFISVRMDHRQEEAEISEAEEQFFEVYNTGEEWATEFKEAKNENRMTQSVAEHKQMEKGTLNETYEKPEQDAEKLKPAVAELAEVEQFFEVSDTGEDWPATFEFKEAENANNLIGEDKLEEKGNMDEISKKPKQRDGELNPVEVDGNSEGTEKKIRVCDETRVPPNYEEQSSKLRSDVHIINQEIVDSRIQVAQVHEETEKIEPVHGRDKYEEKSRDMQEPMKHDERLGTQRMEELEFSMRQSGVLTSVEKEKEVEEACKLEGYKKEQNDAHWVENVENNFEKGSRSETIEATLYDINSAGETEKIPGDDSASEENEKLHEDVSEEKMFMVDDYQTKDYHKIQEKTGQWVDGMMEANIVVSAGCEEAIKETIEDLLDQNGLEATEDLYGQYESDSLNIIPKSIVIGFHGSMDSSPEVPACEETKYIKEGSKSSLELEEKGMELEPVEENNEVEEREILETDGLPQGFKLSEILKQMEDTMGPSFWGRHGMNLGGADVNFVENLKYKHAWEFETVCSSGNGREESAPGLEVKGVIKENEEDVGFDVKAHHLSDVSERKGENLGLEQPMEAGASTEKYREEEEEIPISQSAENNEESQQETDSSPSSENNEESQQETDSSPSSENNEDEFDKMLTSQVMERSEEYHQESLASQNAKPAEEIYQTTLIAEEIECNDSFQKESELEKEEPRRKTDEKNERERYKEKEKKAVERAIREARERAFSEARERAAVERAAAKSRQRERLGKTSIESNNKSLSEKASKEAKLKAERAAVERVLAEARERALEKAMSFKSSPRATKHAERFVDEKKSSVFRDTGIKRSASSVDPQDKGSCSSNHNERFDGANGESAPRCKARFERQQRTAERAAKALAEKNMRDLLVQREQAERNRLAEIIDAEVKRWSSGKEGNIRALLSTLQYILGPGSGWQPIPLTDVITTVAVKKAYRRATLSVHPDKLQQRGASIQQKYTCEKVFDLLKDAWNRFNVEER